MALASSIEWTEASWNPTTGCSKVSSGCRNCYAERLTERLRAMGQKKYGAGFEFAEHESEVDLPLRWKKPRIIFVNSMSDLFHEDASVSFVGRCFDTMLRADWHTYQVLTKRPALMADFTALFRKFHGFDVPGHIWLGTSVESNAVAGRIDDLRRARCAVRFVSFEPLLEEIDTSLSLRGVDWAIIGGESGPGHRLLEGGWVDSLIKMCRRDKVRVFFKQWGGPRPKSNGRDVHGKEISEYPIVPPASPPAAKKISEARNAAPGLGLSDRRATMSAL